MHSNAQNERSCFHLGSPITDRSERGRTAVQPLTIGCVEGSTPSIDMIELKSEQFLGAGRDGAQKSCWFAESPNVGSMACIGFERP